MQVKAVFMMTFLRGWQRVVILVWRTCTNVLEATLTSCVFLLRSFQKMYLLNAVAVVRNVRNTQLQELGKEIGKSGGSGRKVGQEFLPATVTNALAA